jgi:hypothetical protein
VPVREDGPEAVGEAGVRDYKFDDQRLEQRLLTRVAMPVRHVQEDFGEEARIFELRGFDARLGRVLGVRFGHEISPVGKRSIRAAPSKRPSRICERLGLGSESIEPSCEGGERHDS